MVLYQILLFSYQHPQVLAFWVKLVKSHGCWVVVVSKIQKFCLFPHFVGSVGYMEYVGSYIAQVQLFKRLYNYFHFYTL